MAECFPQADVAQTVALVVFIVEEEYIQFADLLQEGVFMCDEGCGGVVAVVTGWEFGPFVEKDDLAVFPVGLQKAFRQSGGRLVEGKENVAFPGVGESQGEPGEEMFAKELDDNHKSDEECGEVDDGKTGHVEGRGVHGMAHLDEVGMEKEHLEGGHEGPQG